MIKYRLTFQNQTIESLVEQELLDFVVLNNIQDYSITTVEEIPVIEFNKKDLRIYSLGLVNQQFEHLTPDKIDFTTHLQPNIFLKKEDVPFTLDARPIEVIYTYQGLKIARRRFDFGKNSMNFLTSRKVYLGYYDLNDQINEEYLIESWEIDPNSKYDKLYITQERKQARSTIFDEIKENLNTWIYMFYVVQDKTYSEILNIGSSFWAEYSTLIDAWINVGGKEELINKLNTDTNSPFFIS